MIVVVIWKRPASQGCVHSHSQYLVGAPSPSMPAVVQCSIDTVSLQLLQYYRSPGRGSGQVSWQTNHSSIMLSKPSGRSCTTVRRCQVLLKREISISTMSMKCCELWTNHHHRYRLNEKLCVCSPTATRPPRLLCLGLSSTTWWRKRALQLPSPC